METASQAIGRCMHIYYNLKWAPKKTARCHQKGRKILFTNTKKLGSLVTFPISCRIIRVFFFVAQIPNVVIVEGSVETTRASTVFLMTHWRSEWLKDAMERSGDDGIRPT